MADMSWFSALAQGGASGCSSDYDQLKNQPVINLTGTGVVIRDLTTGVYNINGTWKMTADDIERTTQKDDLFYVLNTETENKLSWVSASGIQIFKVAANGTAQDIVIESIATTGEVMNQLVGNF